MTGAALSIQIRDKVGGVTEMEPQRQSVVLNVTQGTCVCVQTPASAPQRKYKMIPVFIITELKEKCTQNHQLQTFELIQRSWGGKINTAQYHDIFVWQYHIGHQVSFFYCINYRYDKDKLNSWEPTRTFYSINLLMTTKFPLGT